MIKVNRTQISNDFDEWRDTEPGKEHFGMGGAMGAAFFFCLCLVTAIFLICTIIGIMLGFKLLMWTLKLGPIKPDPDWDKLKVVLAPNVIANSGLASGATQVAPALFVATFEDESKVSPLKLVELSNVMAKIYMNGAETRDEQLLLPIVKDDVYSGDKAVRLPERWTGPHDIFAWSAQFTASDAGFIQGVTGEKVYAAFVGVPKASDDSEIDLTQIPWSIVERGVDVQAKPALQRSRDGFTAQMRQEERRKIHRGQFLRNMAMTALLLVLPFGFFFITAQQGSDAAESVQHSKVFFEKIGDLESCRWSMWGSLNANKGEMVYNVKGTRGKGKLIVYDRILRQKRYWLEIDGRKFELKPR